MSASHLDQIARRFGLKSVIEPTRIGLRRNESTAWFDHHSTDDLAGRHAGFCLALGARLGLDLRAHAAPRDLGDLEWTQRLLPRAAVQVAEAIAGQTLLTEPWLDAVPFHVAYTRESGKLLLAATMDDHLERDDARRALFYSAYRLRPAATIDVGTGKLRQFQTTGGLGSSVCTLFPDFDFDASRDHGVLAVPGYDRMLVFRPNDGDVPWAELRRIVRDEMREAPLPFSCRLYSLRRDRIIPAEVCGAFGDLDAAHLAANLLEVVA